MKNTNSGARERAREFFGIVGDSNMVMHHIDPTMKTLNPERYNQWNPEDLIVMTRGEHLKKHVELGTTNNRYWAGKKRPEEANRKTSETLKGHVGYVFTAELRQRISNSLKGRPLKEETKAKMSAARKGISKSEEHKRRISESTKGRFKGKHWKLVDGKRVWYELLEQQADN